MMKLFPWFQSDIADSPGEAISVRNILSSTPEMRKLMDGSGVNIDYYYTKIFQLASKFPPSVNLRLGSWVEYAPASM